MPTYSNTENNHGPNSVPRDSFGRYLAPEYPAKTPLPAGTDPVRGSGPMRPWTRVSTIAHTGQQMFGITAWQKRHLIKGLSASPDLIALGAATPMHDKGVLDDIADQAEARAAIRSASNWGTALHALVERVDAEALRPVYGTPPLEIPKGLERHIDNYRTAMARHELVPIEGMSEMRVARPDLAESRTAGVMGTFDQIKLHRGRPTVCDVKTGGDPLTHGDIDMSIQLGPGYAGAWGIWDGEFWHPMPEGMNQDYGLIIHLSAQTGECEVHELDLRPAFQILPTILQLRGWHKLKGKLSKQLEPDREPGDLVEDDDGAPLPGDDNADSSEVLYVQAVGRGPGRIGGGYDPATREQQLRDIGESLDRDARASLQRTPQQRADQATADKRHETAAKVLQHPTAGREPAGEQREPEVADLKKLHGQAADQQAAEGLNGEGKPLAPLAGPGQRGCSVCGRKGHRKGSPACLGDRDPAVAHARSQGYDGAPYAAPANAGPGTAEQIYDVVIVAGPKQGTEPERGKTHVHGVDGWSSSAEGLWICATEGCGAPAKTHVHGVDGWTSSTAGLWTCASEGCGAPAADVAEGRTMLKQLAEQSFPGQVTDPAPEHIAGNDAPQYVSENSAEFRGESPDDKDPFADEPDEGPKAEWARVRQAAWLDLIEMAESKADIRDIRARAVAAGEWNDELLEAGKARIARGF